MFLQHPEQIVDFAVFIVDKFSAWPLSAAQKDATHANKWFGIGGVVIGIDEGADPFGKVTLAAQVGRDWSGRLY